MSAIDYATETVWVVSYSHRHGVDVQVCATEELAWRSVAGFVDDWAEDELGEANQEDLSKITDLLNQGTTEATREALTLYLDHVADETVDVIACSIRRK